MNAAYNQLPITEVGCIYSIKTPCEYFLRSTLLKLLVFSFYLNEMKSGFIIEATLGLLSHLHLQTNVRKEINKRIILHI